MCASMVGDSEDMNVCRADCDGTPPQKPSFAPKDPPAKPKKSTKKQSHKDKFLFQNPRVLT